jgi:hypothetical protein
LALLAGILDCIFNKALSTYFVLDMMCWKANPLYDTDTEFRSVAVVTLCYLLYWWADVWRCLPWRGMWARGRIFWVHSRLGEAGVDKVLWDWHIVL